MHEEPDNADVSRTLLSRRRLLALSGVTVAGAGMAALGVRSATAGVLAEPAAAVSPSEAAGACALISETIEGPYYIDGMLRRRDVTEDRAGVPLTLALRVIDGRTCRPLPNVAVEIWHCDAEGLYSGYTSIGAGGGGPVRPTGAPPSGAPSGPPPGGGGIGHVPPTDDLTWLRGLQISDRRGVVSFRTIVPGWYTGRAVHIHTKVHTDGTATQTGYTGGRTCHTGQLYFEEALVTRLHTLDPYRRNDTVRTTLDQDFLYPDNGAAGGLLDLRYRATGLNRGVSAQLTLSVDPQATNNGQRPPESPPASS
ncbi:MAG TPA: intradiol ring-cleavage dioxygenase [Actinoplanes sp.]